MNENVPEIDGGEGGGPPKLFLRRSELAILRKSANRFPFTDGERQEVVETVMDVLRKTKSPRTKLSAVKVVAELERVNLGEVAAYLCGRKHAGNDLTPAQGSTVNVNVAVGMSVQAILDEYADVISPGRIKDEPAAIDNSAKQIHSPETNGKAGPIRP